jgi:hypothetical protein
LRNFSSSSLSNLNAYLSFLFALSSNLNSSACSKSKFLNSLLFSDSLNNSIDKDTWAVNLIRLKFTYLDDVVSFGDDNLSSCGAVRVEVSSSGMENKIAFLVCFPALNEGKVTSD